MNLKEAFRYQKFLDRMMYAACSSIQRDEHCILTKKTHLRSAANPDTEDITEVIETEPFVNNDTVIEFIKWLIEQKEQLSTEIGNAKKSIEYTDIDAAIEANKYRQKAAAAIEYMLRKKPRKRQEQGIDYKFNAEGNQLSYYYKIDVSEEEMFDRVSDKSIQRELLTTADNVSAAVDAYMINTTVDYNPVYSVNESYDDVIAMFEESHME